MGKEELEDLSFRMLPRSKNIKMIADDNLMLPLPEH
jgi:hypothetical protein